MSETIDYGNLMHTAMRGLIKSVLRDVERDGLPGEHHFFISFDTNHPGAELADWLRERFPDDLTIVMQHWFDDLRVDDEGFAVTLNFGDNPEPLYIPYDAIRTFVDPSVEFGLRFDSQETDAPDETHESDDPIGALKSLGDAPDETGADDSDAEKQKDAEVVSLDSFRK